MDLGVSLKVFEWLILGYFLALNTGYISLTLLSLRALLKRRHETLIETIPPVFTSLDIPVSILVPAFNEQATIVASVRSMLQLTYAEFEVIVINDGSRDETLAALITAFDLKAVPQGNRYTLPTQPVRAIYRSARHHHLWVIDKENGGKADSLNAGINLARHPLFCAVDADSVLERDGLKRLVKPFLRNPDMVVSGGTIRVANGCEVRDGNLMKVALPTNPWALFQVVEYLRAFLFGRLGWSELGAVLIISGAFGLFRTETVVEVGGYRTKTIGEDMELVVRLHRLLRAQGRPCPVEFIAESVCWTEAPEDRQTLRNQRIRWQRGLCESLSLNAGLLFNRRGGTPGWVAFPFFILFEWLGPLLEFLGYLFMVASLVMGSISWPTFAAFLFAALALGVLLSMMGLFLEEMTFHLYPKTFQLLVLAAVAILENFGYRQLNTWWRLIGLYRWALQQESQWGAMKRKGNWQKPSA